jgi:hypothetical protein
MFNSEKGLVGDWQELLPHRTGVEQVLTWITQRGFDFEVYPGEPGQGRGDACVFGKMDGEEQPQKFRVEVLSAHHDHAMWARKYNMFAQDDSIYALWIFENREEASKAVNYITENPATNCSIANAPLRNNGQYALKTINKYIEDSKSDSQYTCDGIDQIQTLTSIHNKLDRGIRRPVAIWNTELGEIEILTKTEQESISMEEYNHGAELEPLVAGPDTIYI